VNDQPINLDHGTFESGGTKWEYRWSADCLRVVPYDHASVGDGIQSAAYGRPRQRARGPARSSFICSMRAKIGLASRRFTTARAHARRAFGMTRTGLNDPMPRKPTRRQSRRQERSSCRSSHLPIAWSIDGVMV
jgi:hypothetical protein